MSAIPTLRPLGETLGTEVRGINLATGLDAPTIAWIRETFADHPVMVNTSPASHPRDAGTRNTWRQPGTAVPVFAGA